MLGCHFPIRMERRRYTCGGCGCTESEAGGWALPQVCREWPGFAQSALAHANLDFKTLFTLAAGNDKVALEIREHFMRA